MSELIDQTAINFLTESKISYISPPKNEAMHLKTCIKPQPPTLPISIPVSKKMVSFEENISKKTFTPPSGEFYDRYKEYIISTSSIMKKIKIKIPIIKYIDHIIKCCKSNPYQLRIELYRSSQLDSIKIKAQTINISQYHININLSVDIRLNVNEKIYLSIYMVNSPNSVKDFLDWLLEFEKIRHFLISNESYKQFKINYYKSLENCPDLPEQMSDHEESNNETIDFDKNDDLAESFEENEDDKELPVYFIADFYFDQADLTYENHNTITLKDFFTQSIVQYIISN